MTKQEVLLALKKGLKVTHSRLDQKWMKEVNGMYVFSDGNEVRPSAFWVIRNIEAWDGGWEIVND